MLLTLVENNWETTAVDTPVVNTILNVYVQLSFFHELDARIRNVYYS